MIFSLIYLKYVRVERSKAWCVLLDSLFSVALQHFCQCEGDLVILHAGMCGKETASGSMPLRLNWIGHLSSLTQCSGRDFIRSDLECLPPSAIRF